MNNKDLNAIDVNGNSILHLNIYYKETLELLLPYLTKETISHLNNDDKSFLDYKFIDKGTREWLLQYLTKNY